MHEKLLKELEDRKNSVEKLDFDIQIKNRDHVRSFWLHMIVLSSAIVIGVLPMMNGTPTLIKSLTLAKLGLLLIMLVCVFVIFFFQNVLSREKLLLFEQTQFHQSTFLDQENLLTQASKESKSENEIKRIFNESKSRAFHREQEIIAKHLIGGKFVRIRLFIDGNFGYFVSLGFVFGVVLVILSFLVHT